MTFRIPQSADEQAPSEYMLDQQFYRTRIDPLHGPRQPTPFEMHIDRLTNFYHANPTPVETIPVVFRKMTRWEVFLDRWYDTRVWLAQNVLRVRAE